jgi:hypothetical protein
VDELYAAASRVPRERKPLSSIHAVKTE